MSKILQHWEGYVSELGKDSFYCILVDVASIEPDIEAEIPYKEVLEEDKDLLQLGAYLDLIIKDEPEEVILKFKRFPKFTEEEKKRALEEAEKFADEMMDIFENNNEKGEQT